MYFIENMGYTVYLDWREDPQLDRSNVSRETANTLRQRMKQSKCLIFATSESSSKSKWMPWELGFFNGLKKSKVGVLPIVTRSRKSDDFRSQEYLGLYYYMVKTGETIYDNSKYEYVDFENWLIVFLV